MVALPPSIGSTATTVVFGLPGWAIGLISVGAVIGALAIVALIAGTIIATMWFFGMYEYTLRSLQNEYY